MNSLLPTSASAVDAAALFARAVYGGETIPEAFRRFDPDTNPTNNGDDYRGYLADLGWTVLTDDAGGFASQFVPPNPNVEYFEAGGLYSNGAAQALAALGEVDGQRTLTLSFRGTDEDDWPDALIDGQAWRADGQFDYYNELRPLIDAAYRYASELNNDADTDNDLDQILVTGHSLGALMVDIFTAIDATEFNALPGIYLKVISIASPGIESDVLGGPNGEVGYFSDEVDPAIAQFVNGQLVLTAPDYYIGFAHEDDRVTFPERDGNTGLLGDLEDAIDGLAPNSLLEGQVNFAINDLALDNIDNEDVDYDDAAVAFGAFNHGFGAQHNVGIYWENIHALTTSALLPAYNGHTLLFGVGAYDFTPDFTGPAPDDAGARSLQGSDTEADFILGLDGNDEIFGFGGADLLDGGAGDDWLDGGSAGDSFDGGNGSDTASYASASAKVVSDLADASGNTGDALGDTFIKIENLAGSGFGDILRGDATENTLTGGSGSDRLIARGGNDVLEGGEGADTLNGGGGKDTASYANATSRVIVDLANPADGTSDAAGDVWISIEHLSGSGGADILRADMFGNRIKGEAGADRLYGRAGNDSLRGGAGNDLLAGGTGKDALHGGADNDVFRFDLVSDSLFGPSGRDQIIDFTPGDDEIDLHLINAVSGTLGDNDAFTFIGFNGFSGTAGELRVSKSASLTFVNGDVDGDAIPDLQIELAGSFSLTAGDFIL